MSREGLVGLIAALREQVANRPLLLFLAVLTLLTIVHARRAPSGELRRVLTARVLPAFALLALLTYSVILVWYVCQEQYVDAAEPTIAALARLFEAGRPIYHDIGSAERYSHIYGPMAFIIPSWCLTLLGQTIVTSKIPGAAAGFLSLVAVFALTRTPARPRSALLFTGTFAVLCLMFQSVSFWIRPDSFELLFAGLSLLAAVGVRRDTPSAVLVGAATGLLAGLKMTGPLYALPAFGLMASQRRARSLALAGLVAAATSILPFVVYSNVSFSNYLTWARTSAGNGLAFSTLKQNAEWGVFLLVPLIPSLLYRPDPLNRWLHWSLIAGIVSVVLAASKPGAGPYHLLPFLPAILYAASRPLQNAAGDATNHRHLRLGILAFLSSCALIAFLQTSYFVWAAARTPGAQLAREVTRLVEANPSTRIEMGYSAQNEAYAYVRPILVFHQGTYLVDAPAIQEHQMSGLELPAASVHAIESCQIRMWVIPKGGDPFSLRNRYPATGQKPLFSDAFVAAFRDRYRHVQSTDHFDVWTCRGDGDVR